MATSDLMAAIGVLLGALALWIAWLAYRATATIWIEVLQVKGGYTQTIRRPQGYHYFAVVIRNRGISIDAVRVWFALTSLRHGTHSYEMQRVRYDDEEEEVKGDSEFRTGMVGTFLLTSTQYPNLATDFADFVSVAKNDPKLKVHSHGFLVCKQRLRQRLYWLRSQWNFFAHQVNQRFDRTIVRQGDVPLLYEGHVLPTFNLESQWRTECFIENVLRDGKNLETVRP